MLPSETSFAARPSPRLRLDSVDVFTLDSSDSFDLVSMSVRGGEREEREIFCQSLRDGSFRLGADLSSFSAEADNLISVQGPRQDISFTDFCAPHEP